MWARTAARSALAVAFALGLVPFIAAFERHGVLVVANVQEPVQVVPSYLEMGVAEPPVPVEVVLSQAFLDQGRVSGITYRLVLTAEPADGLFAAEEQTPTVIAERNPAETDGAVDVVLGATLDTRSADHTDVWLIRLDAPVPRAGSGGASEPSTIAIAAIPGGTASAEGTSSSLGTDDRTRTWRVRIGVEITGYAVDDEGGAPR